MDVDTVVSLSANPKIQEFRPGDTVRVNIRIKGTVQTRYEYSNFLQKSFWWFYSLMFYYKQRRQYIEWSKDNVYKMRDFLTKALGIPREE